MLKKELKIYFMVLGLVLLCTIPPYARELPVTGSMDTRVGKLAFEEGYPSAQTVETLYDELGFQRAVQAYLWAVPLVGFARWQEQHEQVFGARDGDVVYYVSYKDKLGLLTSNATTPYIIGMANLARSGPLVIDFPAGDTSGGIMDFWQRPIADMGLAGPDKGAGARYLILGPGQSVKDTNGYTVIQSSMNNIFHAFRVISTDPDEAEKLRRGYQVYPYSTRDTPRPTKIVTPDGRHWEGWHPGGLEYWKLVAKMVNQEPVHDRDRIMVATLKPLGIEKGTPFNPDDRQTKILEEATLVGESMARCLSYAKRQKEAGIWPGTHWKNAVLLEADQETDNYTALDERTAWFYEAVTLTAGMTSKTPGKGQAYIGVQKSRDGQWLKGEHAYTLHVPANAPVEQFWAMTLYDTQTRCFIENEYEIAGLDSRSDLIKNQDGSVDLYFGPKAPEGKEKNWIPTVPGKGWFGYFRFYAPTRAYFDRSWQLPDIVKQH